MFGQSSQRSFAKTQKAEGLWVLLSSSFLQNGFFKAKRWVSTIPSAGACIQMNAAGTAGRLPKLAALVPRPRSFRTHKGKSYLVDISCTIQKKRYSTSLSYWCRPYYSLASFSKGKNGVFPSAPADAEDQRRLPLVELPRRRHRSDGSSRGATPKRYRWSRNGGPRNLLEKWSSSLFWFFGKT